MSRRLLSVLGVAGSLLLSALPARAQTADFAATGAVPTLTGSYQVTLTPNAAPNTWDVNIVANVPNPTVDVMTVVLDFVPAASIASFAAGTTSGGPIAPWTSAVINNGGSSIAFTADPGTALKHDASNHLVGQLVFNAGGAPAAGSFVTAQLSGNAGAYNGYGQVGTVPEPATLALALPGLLPLGLLLRRRRSSR